MEGAEAEGRYDLVVRFSLQKNNSETAVNYVLVFEAKVGAQSFHGKQCQTYRQGISWMEKQERSLGVPVFGLLTVDPERELRTSDGKEDEDCKAITKFHLGWADLLEIVRNARSRIGDGPMADLLKSLCDSIRRWTVRLEDYKVVLKGEALPFPILMDALDVICKRASKKCGAARMNRDPMGAQGPVWLQNKEKEKNREYDGCYRYGYWWRVGESWAGLCWLGITSRRGRSLHPTHI